MVGGIHPVAALGALAGGVAEGLQYNEQRQLKQQMLQRQQFHDALQLMGLAGKMADEQPDAGRVMWEIAQRALGGAGAGMPAPHFQGPEEKIAREFSIQQKKYEYAIRQGLPEEIAWQYAYGVKTPKKTTILGPEGPQEIAGDVKFDPRLKPVQGTYIPGIGEVPYDKVRFPPGWGQGTKPPTMTTTESQWKPLQQERIRDLRTKLRSGQGTAKDLEDWKFYGGKGSMKTVKGRLYGTNEIVDIDSLVDPPPTTKSTRITTVQPQPGAPGFGAPVYQDDEWDYGHGYAGPAQ